MKVRALLVAAAIAANSLGAAVEAEQPQARPVEDYLMTRDVPRYALAVGVEEYAEFTRVPNALTDLDAAVVALQQANFTTIRVVPKATAARFRLALGELAQLVDGKERPAIIAIFFAGHGFQEGGNNFLVPADARRSSLLDDSIDVSDVVRRFSPRKAGVSLLFLDACRTLTTLTGEPPSEGLAGRPPGFSLVRNVDGAVMGMAAGYDQAALSAAVEGETNSPFSQALSLFLNRRDLTVASMLGEIFTYVKVKTQNRQQPEILIRARADTFGFMPANDGGAQEAELRHWRATLETNRRDCVDAFIINHPDSRYSDAALKWVAELPPGHQTAGGGEQCPRRSFDSR